MTKSASMLDKVENVLTSWVNRGATPLKKLPEDEKMRVGTTACFPLKLEGQDIHDLECFLGLIYP